MNLFIFKIQTLEQEVEKSESMELKSKFKYLVKQARSNNEINPTDLPEILMNFDQNFDNNQVKHSETREANRIRKEEIGKIKTTTERNQQFKELNERDAIRQEENEVNKKKNTKSAYKIQSQAPQGANSILEQISFLFVNKKYKDLVKLFEERIMGNIQELRSIPQSYQSLFTWSLFKIVNFKF